MGSSNSQLESFRKALLSNGADYGVTLSQDNVAGLAEYSDLLNTWNPRLHLVAPCSPQEFAERHILESLLLLQHLPQAARIADIGSGGGLPIVPCLIVRPDISATIIESSKKKAVFLSEALRFAGRSDSSKVIAERFERIAPPTVEFVSCRALERFADQLPAIIKWSPPGSTMMFFGGVGLGDAMKEAGLEITEIKIPNSERRFLFLADSLLDD